MIEEADQTAENYEADDCPYCPKKTDDSKVFKEQGFSKVVTCSKDDGGQDEGKEYLIRELDLPVQCKNKYCSHDGSQSNGHNRLVQVRNVLDF